MKIMQLRRAALAAVFVITSPAWADPVDQVGPIACSIEGTTTPTSDILVSHSPIRGSSLKPPQPKLDKVETYVVKVTVPASIQNPQEPPGNFIAPCPVEISLFTGQSNNMNPGITTLFTLQAGFSRTIQVYLEPTPDATGGLPGYVGFECQIEGEYCQFSYTATLKN
jgi:hypothetical protein